MSESRAAALRSLLFASSAAGMLVAAPAFAAETAAEDVAIATAPQTVGQTEGLDSIDVTGRRIRRARTPGQLAY